ncbi:ROK family protein [Actinomadura sp. 6K520]|jgi:glucokinase|uniref:ROK family protein n=1 Tax=Actinomadura sp. 6K520 TaxID=2530364 RepID=UPI0010432A9D|nr:ROK family protein [Actinomadura sp. 6K520]TDE28968.1 ROK family protein [Actinomadura sp. 6K520]
MTVLALDIGGTKFAVARVAADGTFLDRAEHPVGQSPTATLRGLVADFAGPGLTGVGIGSAGPIDAAAGTVSPINIPRWREFPLVATVRRFVPGVPVSLAGDAQCMALGEWWRGGRTCSSLLGIVVSTGVGGGLVIDGRPWTGRTGNAGHIGHVIVDPGGEPCVCGARGCLETIASGPGMVRWALAQGWTLAMGRPDARALTAAARDGARIPLAAFGRTAAALATAILNTAAVLDVRDVVIGGGLSAAGDLLLDPLRDTIAERAGMPYLRDLQVSATTLHRDAGLHGAAALALLAAGEPLREPF